MKLVDPDALDLRWLHDAVGSWECTTRWSLWAHTPSPPFLRSLIWGNSQIQAVVLGPGDTPVGLVQVSNANLDDGHADLDYLADPDHRALVDAALRQTIDRAFRDYPLRKLCLRVVEDEHLLGPAVAEAARHVGTLAGHVRRGEGLYADVLVYELWRHPSASSPEPAASAEPERESRRRGSRPPAPTHSRRVRLEPLGDHHIGPLHRLVTQPALAHRWPLRGREMTAAELAEHLWRGSRLQYAVARRDSGDVIGLVQGIDENARSKTIGLSFVVDPGLWRQGWPFEAAVLFMGLLFDVKGFRKVYLHMAESDLHKVAGPHSRWLRREATFERHRRRGDQGDGDAGGYEAWHVCAVHRDAWDPGVLRLIGAPSR